MSWLIMMNDSLMIEFVRSLDLFLYLPVFSSLSGVFLGSLLLFVDLILVPGFIYLFMVTLSLFNPGVGGSLHQVHNQESKPPRFSDSDCVSGPKCNLFPAGIIKVSRSVRHGSRNLSNACRFSDRFVSKELIYCVPPLHDCARRPVAPIAPC